MALQMAESQTRPRCHPRFEVDREDYDSLYSGGRFRTAGSGFTWVDFRRALDFLGPTVPWTKTRGKTRDASQIKMGAFNINTDVPNGAPNGRKSNLTPLPLPS